MKTVLDSVHGTISIPKVLFRKVIDSEHFQRLRRIEQNSCRSVYPSARHDRFIHSLGVYYIGSRIADEIDRKYNHPSKDKDKDEDILPPNWGKIKETYKLACLLHDVGHTPFSHTFEEYFGREYATNKLKELFKDTSFGKDCDISNKHNHKAAEHELISAMVAVEIYRPKFMEEDGNDHDKDYKDIDWELLVRMITGYRYLEHTNSGTDDSEYRPKGSFENTMIELIHGDIIDADGLDYVCRDVWAGGYRNYNINLNRLISSINIQKEKEENEGNDENSYRYSVIYSSKALNEIETVLNVKNFQYLYVIKHHKVLLEQYYLIEAMKSAACHHCKKSQETSRDREDALRTICNPEIFTGSIVLERYGYKLTRPTDDDFVALMKLVPRDDKYIKEVKYIKGWFSRIFSHKPLWKSKLEYFNIFTPVIETIDNESTFNIVNYLNDIRFEQYLEANTDWKREDIIVIPVTSKIRHLDPKKIKVSINNENITFSQLHHDSFSVTGSNKPFCYVYFDFERNNMVRNKENINKVVEVIKNYLSEQLRALWTPNSTSEVKS